MQLQLGKQAELLNQSQQNLVSNNHGRSPCIQIKSAPHRDITIQRSRSFHVDLHHGSKLEEIVGTLMSDKIAAVTQNGWRWMLQQRF